MKIVGLITEYNPFHNGHQYHIQKARQVTGADKVLVVMSGDYVQRGVPAFLPKRLRAEMALRCGADLVIELPVCYSTGSAESFALGAVSLLDCLGVVDYLCFGSECNDLNGLDLVAQILSEEPEEYKTVLKDSLRQGLSFPSARQKAFLEYSQNKEAASLLCDPNNILAIEYLKALKKRKSRITPVTIQRKGASYHDLSLSGTFCSASSIRASLTSGSLSALKTCIPSACLSLMEENYQVRYPVQADDFSLILKYRLMDKKPDTLAQYTDVSEELARRIVRCLDQFLCYEQFCSLLKTKEITQSRVNRALLHILLDLKKESLSQPIHKGTHFYARVLGIKKESIQLLSLLSRTSSVPVITRISDGKALPLPGQEMLRKDILASNLYGSVVTDKFKAPFLNECRSGILKC